MSPVFPTLAEYGIAYQHSVGDNARPGIMFLGGFASDMNGTKACFLADRCAANNISYLRFDYRGNGQSTGRFPGGDFRDGTIGLWLEDATLLFDRLTIGPQILVGSSMGGWIGLILATARKERVKAFIGIAAAPDFTEDLAYAQMTKAERAALKRDGEVPGGHAPLTLKLIEEARQHLILRAPIDVAAPVRLLQGGRDDAVPPGYPARITKQIPHQDVKTIMVEDGDHRLSRDADLDLLWNTIGEFL